MGFKLTPHDNMAGSYVSEERLYLTREGEVVADGHADADSLLVGAGGTISEADAERYGLLGKKPAAKSDAPAAEPEPATKAEAPAATPAVAKTPAAKGKGRK